MGTPPTPRLAPALPQRTLAGVSFYDYYEFKIFPDSALFYTKITGKQLHEPFEPFSTRNMAQVIEQEFPSRDRVPWYRAGRCQIILREFGQDGLRALADLLEVLKQRGL